MGTAAGDQGRGYDAKQMGDACEMLVAAEMTLAGVPAMRVPDLWPGYDVIAQPVDRPPQRVSVKSRTFKRGSSNWVAYDRNDKFEWWAIVLLPGDGETRRRIFIIPRHVADEKTHKDSDSAKTSDFYLYLDEVATKLREFENNFTLLDNPVITILGLR